MPTLISGSYTTVDSNPVILKLPFIPSFFEVWVQGNSAGNVWTSTNGAIKRAVYQQTMPAGSALCQAGSATGDISTYLSSNGITPITALPYLGPVVAGTGVTSANPGVITITPNNAFSSGSLVQFPTATGAAQLTLFPWIVNQVTANTYNLGVTGNLFNTSIFPAATAITAQQLFYPNAFNPTIGYITGISLGNTTTISTSYPLNLQINNTVTLIIPSPWGSTSLNGLFGKVTQVINPLQFVLNINSSSASQFTFPTNAQALSGVTPAQVIPFGDFYNQNNLASYNNTYSGIAIGNSSTAGSAILNGPNNFFIWRGELDDYAYTSTFN